MDTLVPDILVEQKKEESRDKRVKESLGFIQIACKVLLNEQEKITTTSVGKYCTSHFGKPTVRTLHNDNSNIYKMIINAYAKLAPKLDSTKEHDNLDDIPLVYRIRINNLETQNKTLKNIVDKHFRESTDGRNHSLVDTLKKGANEFDGATLVDSTKLTLFQKDTIRKLLAALLDTEEFVEMNKDAASYYTYRDSGITFLNEREVKAIKKMLEGE